MQAVQLYEAMLEKYVSSFDNYRRRASKLYAKYSDSYHRFVTARDFHVRLAGGTTFVVGSPISEMERMMFYEQRRCAFRFVMYCLDNFRAENVVGCLPSETEHMSIERVRNELLSEIHTDFGNFINFTEGDGMIHVSFAKIFNSADEEKRASKLFKRLLYAYYPLYARYPTYKRGYWANGSCVGIFEGSVVYSESEHLADIAGVLTRSIPIIPKALRDVILQYLHLFHFRRGISCMQGGC